MPCSPSRKIATRRGNILLNRVEELIDAETGTWDEQLIRDTFWPIDALRILNIPLVHHMMNDFVGWHYNKSGIFSVRSCYHVEWEHQHGQKLRRTSGYGSSSTLQIWKILWSLNVPAKIKIHCWRALHGAIPCNGVLANRHMQPSSQCTLCNTGCESIRHAFFSCPRVQEIWRILGMEETISQVGNVEVEGRSTLEALLRDKTAKAPRIEMVERNDLVAVAVWYIWWERRKATHGETVQSPARTAHATTTLVLNYTRAKKKRPGIHRHGWVKPRENYVKLNVDASFNVDAGTGSTGVVIRDDKGFFLAASCRGLPFVSDPATAEAHVLRDGLILAGQLGCNRIEVNSDSMEVIETMRNGGNSLGVAAAIYEECTMLCRNFGVVIFDHSLREANMAAHLVASHAEGSMSVVWHEDPPDYLVSTLADDVTMINA